MEVPQLPVISVVMPWKSLLSGWKLSRGHASEWLWMSMKPGAVSYTHLTLPTICSV